MRVQAKPSAARFRVRFGAALRVFRKANGHTQAKLAILIGTSRTAVHEIEKGKRAISVTELVGLDRFYRIDLVGLLRVADGRDQPLRKCGDP